ncbi:mannose/fructose/sorbose PTS transporter subunit IIB [Vagococcus sp. PNs007]|uniref:Mannose/fructose/sorbose PTS transporter subunit IIB n=1 Tax=Vagococcus proximus TaxID=2991417 RepID=A0ABT5WZN5_9ENTE|nr:mannose/fructose/sorbose PTS transporter subunit IIB [Vagococcus proximus]MDF0479223.1 mannose/fructose/sorbose PTS transporter subunit IIB [Vagococcus proximus]
MSMTISLARIDDRLIHGQVATVWTKAFNINRIIVVSDTVAYDHLRKQLLIQAAPPGVKVNVITVKKMIDIFPDNRFNDIKAMLLFTNPHDVKRLVSGGIFFDTINIGGMSFSHGKKMITNAVAVDQKDIDTFKYLANEGIELEIRKVVADSKVNLISLLEKEKLL